MQSNFMSMKKIAERLRLLRQEKGYSQQYIADILKVSIATISRLENNPEEIKLRYLISLAQLYKMDLCKLFSTDESELENELSKLTVQVTIPIDITSTQLFRVAKKLQEKEQYRKQ
jgi:transcriptional regulator with XRE-family HTH domain